MDAEQFRVQGSKYLFWQLERGENGTPHIQGFVVMPHPRTMLGMKRLIPGAHLEIMRGTVEQNEVYCSKSETKVDGPWREGEKPTGQGHRSDIEGAMAMIKEGERELAVAEAYPVTWCHNYRALGRYRLLLDTGRREPVTTLVLWGPSGVGKSRRALELGGQYDDQFWLVEPRGSGSPFWDGYQAQTTLVIDEFYGWIRRSFLCRLLDRYPVSVDVKGGMVPFRSEKVVITSNKHPRDWYRIGLGPVERRLSEPLGKIVYMGNDVYPDEEIYLNSSDYQVNGGTV